MDNYNIGNFGSHYFGGAFDDVDRKLEKPIKIENAPTAREVGLSSNPMEHQGKALQAAIKEGVSRVELSWMGQGKGSKEAATGESFGRLEREEIRNLARINKIDVSTHASPNVMQISGYDARSGQFDASKRQNALNEIKKAVDFAADASTGGAVVIHLQEWERPIESRYGYQDKEKGNTFKGYEGELFKEVERDGKKEKQAGSSQLMFVDTKSERVQTIRRDMEFVEPSIKHIEYDKTNNFIKTEYDWKNAEHEIPNTEKLDYFSVIEKEKKMNSSNFDQKGDFEGYREYAQDNFTPLVNKWKEIEKMPEKTDEQIQKKNDQIFLFHFLRQQAMNSYDQFLSADNYYRRFRYEEDEIENNLERRNRAWASFQEQLQNLNNIKPIEDYGVDKTASTVADAALYAWQKSQNNKALDKNLYISPESWMPEYYGGHPDEMMEVIDKSREELANKLEKTGKYKDMKEAQKEASKYIKATLDVGHLNTWRNFFQRKKNESTEQYNKRFNEWAMKKSEEMAKKGYLGHAHLSDNFGFNDEHLSVGQGNAPISEFVNRLKKHGVDEFIVERGSYNIETGLRDAWSYLGVRNFSPSYMGAPGQGTPGFMGNMYNAYAGHTRKPSYIFGKLAPQGTDKWNGWAPWSGSPL